MTRPISAATLSVPAQQFRSSAWAQVTMLATACGAICAELVMTTMALDLLPLLSSLLPAHPWLSLLLQGKPSLSSLFLMHLGVCGALIGIAAVLYRRGIRQPIFLLFVVSVAATGPLGAAGAALGAVLHRFFMRRATPFEQWYAALFPTVDTSPARLLYERLVLRGGAPDSGSNVAPFSDVIKHSTVQHKQAVLTLILDEFRPNFAPALRSALNDAEPAIRVQAAAVAARIENQFLNRAMSLEERRMAAPDDPDVLLALARHHDEYANTGLLDSARAQGERQQALAYYERVARARPGAPDIAQAIGRLLVRLGEPARAVEYLEPLAEAPGTPPELLAWYMECLYRLRRLDLLRRAARLHSHRIASSSLPAEVRDAARFWTGDSAPSILEKGCVA